MSRDDLQKLLGGYATGTLTEAERSALFEAALQDQKLFEALADEEALRELLQDSSARAEILASLAPAPKRQGWRAWAGRPAFWATAGSLAAAVVIVAVLVPQMRTPSPSQQIALVQEMDKMSNLRGMQSAESRASQNTIVSPGRERPGLTNQPAPPPSTSRFEAPQKAAKSIGVVGGVPPSAAGGGLAASRDFKESADASAPAPRLAPPAIDVVPAAPLSAAATFRQTAPPAATTEAAEALSEKTKGERRLRSVQAPQALSRAAGLTGTPAIRYELQQRVPGNLYTRIDPDLPLATDSPLRLEVETNKAGYLYAFSLDRTRAYSQLSIGPTVDGHVRHTAELGQPEPDRKLMLIFSEHPIAQFAAGTATDEAIELLDGLRGQTGNRLARRQKSANSVYVTGNPGPAPVLIEITLPTAK